MISFRVGRGGGGEELARADGRHGGLGTGAKDGVETIGSRFVVVSAEDERFVVGVVEVVGPFDVGGLGAADHAELRGFRGRGDHTMAFVALSNCGSDFL